MGVFPNTGYFFICAAADFAEAGYGSGGCWCILKSSGRGFLSEISFALRIAFLDISRSVEGLKGLFCSSFGDSVCACVLVVDIVDPLD